MNILYVGDIMGEPGVETVEQFLPDIIKDHAIDLVIAQAENVTEGRGLSIEDYHKLAGLGVQGFTGGNWTFHREETNELLADPNAPVTRPANYPEDTPGLKYKEVTVSEGGAVLLISLLGSIVGKDADKPVTNPLNCVDEILNGLRDKEYAAIIVNFHGDYSSEKVIIGHYLDGRVSAVVGDHWHVPTADGRVLPGGTAHITDVGMCGALNSSLGISLGSVIPRWRDNLQTKNEIETNGPRQFNAVVIAVDPQTRLSSSIKQIQL